MGNGAEVSVVSRLPGVFPTGRGAGRMRYCFRVKISEQMVNVSGACGKRNFKNHLHGIRKKYVTLSDVVSRQRPVIPFTGSDADSTDHWVDEDFAVSVAPARVGIDGGLVDGQPFLSDPRTFCRAYRRFRDGILPNFSLPDHGQHHLEPLPRLHCMRLVCRQDDRLTGPDREQGTGDRDLGHAIGNREDGIVRCGML